jgi:hypothetical protein
MSKRLIRLKPVAAMHPIVARVPSHQPLSASCEPTKLTEKLPILRWGGPKEAQVFLQPSQLAANRLVGPNACEIDQLVVALKEYRQSFVNAIRHIW